MFTDGRRLIAAAGLAGALCLALAAPVVAQQQAPAPALGTATGKVTGKLLEKGKDPIAYANVIVLGTKNGTMTDESGTYVLTGSRLVGSIWTPGHVCGSAALWLRTLE